MKSMKPPDPSPSAPSPRPPLASIEGSCHPRTSSSPHFNEVIGDGSGMSSQYVVQIPQSSLPPPAPLTRPGQNTQMRKISAAAGPNVLIATSKQMSYKRKAIRATRKFIKLYYDNIPLGKVASRISSRGTKRPRDGVSADASNPHRPLAAGSSDPLYESSAHAGFPAGTYAASALPVLAAANAPISSSAAAATALAPASTSSPPSAEVGSVFSTPGANIIASNPQRTGANSATATGSGVSKSAAAILLATGDVKSDVAQCESHSDLARLMQSKETLVERRRTVLQILQALNQVNNHSAAVTMISHLLGTNCSCSQSISIIPRQTRKTRRTREAATSTETTSASTEDNK